MSTHMSIFILSPLIWEYVQLGRTANMNTSLKCGYEYEYKHELWMIAAIAKWVHTTCMWVETSMWI